MSTRLYISLLILNFSLNTLAQEKDGFTLFCPSNNYQSYGMFVGAGASITSGEPLVSTFQSSVSNTANYQMTVETFGEIGYGGDIGTMLVNRKSFIRLIEFGFNYRQFTGGERLTGVRTPGGDISFPDVLEYNGRFKYHRASFRVNAQAVVPLGMKSFIHLGPGLTIEETIGQKNSYDLEHITVNTEIPDKPSSSGVNVTVGVGFKIGEGRFVDIYGHMPLMSFANENILDTSEEIFNSKYNNRYLGLRFFWVKGTPDRVCPAMSKKKPGTRLSKKKLRSDSYPW